MSHPTLQMQRMPRLVLQNPAHPLSTITMKRLKHAQMEESGRPINDIYGEFPSQELGKSLN